MKKLLAILLALMLVLVNASFAMATDVDEGELDTDEPTVVEEETTATGVTPKAITIPKNYVKDYTDAESAEATVKPTETLTFAIEADEKNPAVVTPTVAAKVESGITTGMTITFPEYTVAGLYEYTVTEVAGTSQGAQYNNEDMTLKVFISYDEDHKLVADTGITIKVQDAEDGSKETEIYNEYNVGKLTVGKTVSGNLSSTTAEFNVTVTFATETGKTVNSDITVSKAVKDGSSESTTIAKGWTGSKEITFTLHDGETVDFTNIPAGVTYTFTEADEHKLAEGDTLDPNSDEDKQYTATGEITTATAIVADQTATATINNEKATEIETGISTDVLPYVLLMATALIGIAVMVIRKREEY